MSNSIQLKGLHKCHTYHQHGRVSLSGDVIGSMVPGRNSCQSSSVIAAYWPGTGSSLLSIDYTKKRIGVVQYFIHHSLEVYKDHGRSNKMEKLQYLYSALCIGKSNTLMPAGTECWLFCVMTASSHRMHAVSCLFKE